MSSDKEKLSCALNVYKKLHDSPMQRKFRKLHPWPVGSVFIEWPGMTEDDIRAHFRKMRELGFTCLKQLCVGPNTDKKRIMHIALDEGVIPWWYGEAGWENPTPELVKSLGIDPDISIQELRENPVWLKRQEQIMRQRIEHEDNALHITATVGPEKGELPGTYKKFVYGLPPELAQRFTKWLKRRYKSLDMLKRAWNFDHTMVSRYDWNTWEDVENEVIDAINQERREYSRMSDVLRFKTDIYMDSILNECKAHFSKDPNAPTRAGGEMSLFLPYATMCTNFEDIADIMSEYGSLYPSIHLSWHFEEVDYEAVRTVYMQASMAADWFKNGWSATWESTGGPQMFTGGKGHLYVGDAKNTIPGFTVDGNTMAQLMLSWVAGGFKGFGLWSWNPRSFGWEGGEYGLCDRDNKPTDRAVVAGSIGRACRKLRDELWESYKEPIVGLFHSWDNDAVWGVMSVGGRDIFRNFPAFARVGASRALINKNVPWEYVSDRDIRKGLINRYKTIYIPANLLIHSDVINLLYKYVQEGGRVVLDAPGAWYDEFGRIISTAEGSPFEQLFGARIPNLQYSNPINRPWKLRGNIIEGFTMDIEPTAAKVVECFDDGKPSIVEHRLGKGTAIIIAWQAALTCRKPGNDWAEKYLSSIALGSNKPPYECDECIVYRLAAPTADNYFLINDKEKVSAYIRTCFQYRYMEDPVSGESFEIGSPVEVPAYGARWIRMVK